jgi:hypothetical protein
MKNNLWIILISVVITLSSCITAAQFNNADDDVYYSPKASNRKQPVMIPEVDVDEIIRQNPPKYGEPTNRLDEEYSPNPMASMYYPIYRSFPQDTTYQQNPRVSTYIDPSLATQSETEEAAYLRQMYSDNSNNWNVGLGLSWWGPTFSVGYSNYNNGYYGCDPYYYPYGYPSYGYGYGYGYNNYYNPYYYGVGYSWYGGGYCYPPTHVTPHHENTNTGISRRRPTVGSYTPPANTGRNTEGSSESSTNGRYIAPALPGSESQPASQGRSGRANTPTYTPSAPQQRLENENGRQVYRRQAETAQPAPQSTETNPTNAGSSNRRRSSNEGSTSRSTSPGYNAPSQNVSTPSNVGRSGSSSQGSGRSSGSSSSGSQSSGGRRR